MNYPKATCDPGTEALRLANERADRWKQRHDALTSRLASVEAERDSAQEHMAYHLADFRPGADMAVTGDLAVDMAAYARRLAARLARVTDVHWRYFDDEGTPGVDDTTPEPEDVWRYDRDFRAVLGSDAHTEQKGAGR